MRLSFPPKTSKKCPPSPAPYATILNLSSCELPRKPSYEKYRHCRDAHFHESDLELSAALGASAFECIGCGHTPRPSVTDGRPLLSGSPSREAPALSRRLTRRVQPKRCLPCTNGLLVTADCFRKFHAQRVGLFEHAIYTSVS
jgi:hypothetical protein